MATMTGAWEATCEETGRHLSEHLEGELRGLRRWRILMHLARCDLCASAFQSLRRTVEGLRSLGRPEPAPALSIADAVVARIRREQEPAR